jgi:hypothetical protein
MGTLCTGEAIFQEMLKEHKHIRTLKKVAIIPQDVKDALKGEYTPVSNETTVQLARAAVDVAKAEGDQGIANLHRDMLNVEQPTSTQVAIMQQLMVHYNQRHDFDNAVDIAMHMVREGTKLGRAVQAFSIIQRLSPEGALKFAAKIADKAGSTKRQERNRDAIINKSEAVRQILDKPDLSDDEKRRELKKLLGRAAKLFGEGKDDKLIDDLLDKTKTGQVVTNPPAAPPSTAPVDAPATQSGEPPASGRTFRKRRQDNPGKPGGGLMANEILEARLVEGVAEAMTTDGSPSVKKPPRVLTEDQQRVSDFVKGRKADKRALFTLIHGKPAAEQKAIRQKWKYLTPDEKALALAAEQAKAARDKNTALENRLKALVAKAMTTDGSPTPAKPKQALTPEQARVEAFGKGRIQDKQWLYGLVKGKKEVVRTPNERGKYLTPAEKALAETAQIERKQQRLRKRWDVRMQRAMDATLQPPEAAKPKDKLNMNQHDAYLTGQADKRMQALATAKRIVYGEEAAPSATQSDWKDYLTATPPGG